jgi:3-deoxy-manno-octulosonate cytidylyltransferase (CMP-KDO synthetase)
MMAGSGDFRVVVPARFGASRLPGKPLREIAGKPLVLHVWECANRSGASEVIVATDDERIAAVVEDAGGRALMTSPEHMSGTDRLAEVATMLQWGDDAIVVNLQGDEPLVPGELLNALARALQVHPRAGVATVATPIASSSEVFDPNIVKVTIDRDGFALYFSRAPIPFVRGAFSEERAREAPLPEDVPFLRHIGLYAYRAATLRLLAFEPQASIERAESLEQLRALALGIDIHVTTVRDAPPPGVDTEHDLARLRATLEG